MSLGERFISQINPTTAKLIRIAERLTEHNPEKNSRADAWIKALDSTYEKGEWIAYCYVSCMAMWAMLECEGKYFKRMLQYSNDFIRFSKEQLPQVLATERTYSSWAASMFITCYGYLHSFYRDYYQIDDSKLEELFKLYDADFDHYRAYDTDFDHSFERMIYAVNNNDKEGAATHLRRVLLLEKETGSCYVCKNINTVKTLIFLGRVDEALGRIEQIIGDIGIPEDWYLNRKNCENSNAYSQYDPLIINTLWLKKPDLLARFIKDYKDYIITDEDFWDNVDLLVLGATNSFDIRREFHLRECVASSFNELNELTPLGHVEFYLCSYVYLSMLHKNGIETAELDIVNPPIEPIRDNIYNVSDLASHCLKKADFIGAKFDKSRKEFNYQGLRNTALSLI